MILYPFPLLPQGLDLIANVTVSPIEYYTIILHNIPLVINSKSAESDKYYNEI